MDTTSSSSSFILYGLILNENDLAELVFIKIQKDFLKQLVVIILKKRVMLLMSQVNGTA